MKEVVLDLMGDDDTSLLIGVRRGNAISWERLIARYQARLLAFVRSRLNDEGAAEDVVQETFLGFLVALPNYDDSMPLESFLFSIAAHKLTDALRRAGRRPTLPLIAGTESRIGNEPPARDRKASSLARNREYRAAQHRVLSDCLRTMIQSWLSRGEFERLECVELLFVLGWSNKAAATQLGISEQAVANHKDFVVRKLKVSAEEAKLRDVDWNEWKLG